MDLPPQTNRSDAAKDSRVTHAAWALTAEAFAKLLEAFSPDQEEAGRLYLSTHLKLVRFFEWKACRDPEHQVDITLNRVARKLLEGEQIGNVSGYAWGVANLVFKETLKQRDRQPLPLDGVDAIDPESACDDKTREQRLGCLDKCLAELVPESRVLIVGYYQQGTKAKHVRRTMAAQLGIGLNALRIRAHRIRIELEKCMDRCMQAA